MDWEAERQTIIALTEEEIDIDWMEKAAEKPLDQSNE